MTQWSDDDDERDAILGRALDRLADEWYSRNPIPHEKATLNDN